MNRTMNSIPLSHAEKRIYFTQKLYPESSIWNVPSSLRIALGDPQILVEAARFVFSNSPNLRKRFTEKNGDPGKYLISEKEVKSLDIDLLDFQQGGEQAYLNWAVEQSKKQLPMLDAVPYYAAVADAGQGVIFFYSNFHHIAADGGASNLVRERVYKAYKALMAGQEPALPTEPDVEMAVNSEQDYFQSEDYNKDKDYWNSVFASLPEPLDFVGKAQANNLELDCLTKRFSAQAKKALLQFCSREKVSPFRVVLAALNIIFSRTLRREDLVLGTATANRHPKELKNAVGMFVSTLPLRMQIDCQASFKQVVELASQTVRSATAHERYPYDHLTNDLRQRTGETRDLLACSLVEVVHTPLPEDTEVFLHNQGESLISLTFFFSYPRKGLPADTPMEFFVTYNQELFEPWWIKQLLNHVQNVILRGIQDPQCLVRDLDLLGPEERERLLKDFNKNQADWEVESTVQSLIEAKAKRFPGHKAVVYRGSYVTYAQLEARANALARKLREQGAGPDQVVGLLADRSIEIVICQLAILKSGAAFMPIDADYPDSRIKFMLRDIQAPIIITQNRFIQEGDFGSAIVFNMDQEDIFSGDSSYIDNQNSPQDLCTVIYTSGSTGKPKGVLLRHFSICNIIQTNIRDQGLTPRDKLSKHASFSFDASIMEVFSALISAAELHIIPEEIRLSLSHLNEYFLSEGITWAFLTTQLGEQFMEFIDKTSLRVLMVGGEKLRTFKPADYKLLNIYGPTECSIYVACQDVRQFEENIPIGGPIPNCRIYVLDQHNFLQPVGAAGELCIAGAPLALGYHNRPEKTATTFVPDPFHSGEVMYRSGDLAAWRPDGQLEHLGRMDRQVKLRGFRIELGEIENAMLLMQGISEAAVADFKDSAGHVFLCAYYCADQEIDSDALRAHLKEHVPEFMVPTHILELKSMPINPSGKIDRRSLPKPEEQEIEQKEYIPPENDLEKQLLKIWSEVLDVQDLGATADFFQNGGDSLRAVALQMKIAKGLGREIELGSIFENATPRAMARLMQSAEGHKVQTIPQAEKAEFYPVTVAQQQLFLLSRMQGIGTAYNMPVCLEINGELDRNRLSDALLELLKRHEALRSGFVIQEGKCVQRIYEDAFLKLDFAQTSSEDPHDFAQGFVRPFDLNKPPLMRTKLVALNSGKHWLLLDFHHIVCDGVSLGIFLRELMDLYAGKELEPLSIQPKDFATWEFKHQADNIKAHEDFWLDLFTPVPESELPTDLPRPGQTSFAGDIYQHWLDTKTSNSLRFMAKKYGVTLHQVFLAALSTLIGRWSDSEDICLGTSMSGRERPGTTNLMGMFVRTLPTRLRPEKDKSFADLLLETKEQMLTIHEHSEYPISNLYEQLGVNRGPGRHPLFDVNFVMRNTGMQSSLQANSLNADLQMLSTQSAKFDLSFSVEEQGKALSLEVDYRTALYRRDTVVRMAGHLTRILAAVAEEPARPLAEISVLGPEEHSTLLQGFNPAPSPYPDWPTVCQPIADQANLRPDHAAVKADNGSLTYRGLNSLANRAARAIRSAGAARDSIVAVVADRSTWPVVGMLAALKAGAAYVGLDENYPQKRKAFILEDTQAPCLVGTAEQLAAIDFSGPRITLDKDLPGDDSEPDWARGGQDLAYTIFTSGSTGTPKGVMVEHQSMVNFINWYSSHHHITPQSACAAFAAFSFDVSVVQIFAPLISGATLHVVPEHLRRSPQELDEYFLDQGVTHVHFPTQFAEQFMRLCSCKSLKYMIVGGDRLKFYRLKHFRLTNEYGPSETTMACLSYDVPEIMDYPPVGSPVANTRVYILDSRERLCPLGMPGEICVAGSGVARGYLNREELTAKRFVADPFYPQERMFKTGDKGRWRHDGNLDFIGRMDFQVKIRGFRVEPGEIELRIKDTGMVQECVVVALEEPGGNKALAAYCVSGQELNKAQLKESLKHSLPEYMLPSYLVQLDKMPLNPNGKIDRGKLPRPEITSTGGGPLQPRNQKEKRIASAWSSVLGHKGFGLFDSFFEVGGDSLSAITLLADLSETYDISASDIFAHTSIAAQAEHFQQAEVGRSARLLKLKELGEETEPDKALEAEKEHYLEAMDKDKNLDIRSLATLEHVLLTGATGTLGIYLLQGLLQSTSARVTAIVRAKDQQEANKRLSDYYLDRFGEDLGQAAGNRLKVLNGDLSRQDLGLEEKLLSNLEKEVDTILHSAALTSHFGNWETFKAANICSVQNLLALAQKGRSKSMHHVSTTSVGQGRVPERSQVLFTEFDLDVGQDPGNYYVRSKLEAEKLLQQARENGLQVNIYRAGNITCDSKTKRVQKNVEDNAFYQQLKAYVNLGAAPDKMDSRNMTFVDQAARSILELMHRPGLRGQTFHIQNPQQLSLSRALGNGNGCLRLKLKQLPFDKFIEYIAQHAGHAGFEKYVERLLVHLGWQDWLTDSRQTSTVIEVRRTEELLRRCGFTWKTPEAADLSQFVGQALADRISLLRQVKEFENTTEQSLLDLAAKSLPEYYEEESLLQQENQQIQAIQFIMQGMVETYRHSASGWIGTVRVGGAGSCLGEEALPEDTRARDSIEALDGVFALQIAPQDLRRQLEKHPELGLALIKLVNSKVNQAERLFVAL